MDLNNIARKVKVLIIDDQAQQLSDYINSTIDCLVFKSRNLSCYNRYLNNKNYDFLDSYDIVFFDTTYYELDGNNKIEAISILERLIKYDSKYNDSSIVLIADDYLGYKYKENTLDEVKLLISRVQQLSYIVCGNKQGIKTDKMIKAITKVKTNKL